MTTVEAIFVNGVFKPLAEVLIPENLRVRLTIETVESVSSAAGWLDAIQEFQQRIVASHGVLPNSTPEIAADRRRHG